jgi:hypothetical protein
MPQLLPLRDDEQEGEFIAVGPGRIISGTIKTGERLYANPAAIRGM